jgi:hypothetical protein
MGSDSAADARVIEDTRRWVEKAVIGLGLCPFASAVYVADGVRFKVTAERTAAGLLGVLRSELHLLAAAAPRRWETTLLIHPWVLQDFIEFNEFLSVCDGAVAEEGLEGEIQVASFHPQYQFAGTRSDDIENHTNRSPYPTLHLLREDSVERALDTVADPDAIYLGNIRRMRELGLDGWQALWSEQGAVCERPTQGDADGGGPDKGGPDGSGPG